MERENSFIEKARMYENNLKTKSIELETYGEKHILPIMEAIGIVGLKTGLAITALYGTVTVISIAQSDDPLRELVDLYKRLF